MKKIYFVFLLSLMIGVVNAQFQNQQSIRVAHESKTFPISNQVNNAKATVPYLEDFDAGMPVDYQLFDVDGNTVYTSYQSFITDAWSVAQLTGYTTPAATSTSWYNTVGTSNDWMITTGIDIPASGTYEIKWKGKASDVAPYNDSYEVYVTNTIAGATPVVSDFTGAPVFTTTGENNTWTNRNYVLPASFNGTTIYIAFVNNMTDGNLLSVDDIEVKAYVAYVNEIELQKTYLDVAGLGHYGVLPISQFNGVTLKGVVNNIGSATQTNVVLNGVDVPNSLNLTSTGISLSTAVTDTLSIDVTAPSAYTDYNFAMAVTQSETDEEPANNLGDTIKFEAHDSYYFRTLNLGGVLTPYSFGTQAPAVTGMEYGANYHFAANATVDSIAVLIYDAYGTGTVVGKIYNVDLTSGTRTEIAQTSPYTPSGSPELKTLALTSTLDVTAGQLITATVQLNTNISANDTIYIGSDPTYAGDAAVGGAAYLQPAGGSFGWYSVTGTVPLVGLILDIATDVETVYNKEGVVIYPNPTTGVVNIVNAENANVSIFNLVGQEVMNVTGLNNTLDLSELNNGTYVIKVQTENGVTTQKINLSK